MSKKKSIHIHLASFHSSQSTKAFSKPLSQDFIEENVSSQHLISGTSPQHFFTSKELIFPRTATANKQLFISSPPTERKQKSVSDFLQYCNTGRLDELRQQQTTPASRPKSIVYQTKLPKAQNKVLYNKNYAFKFFHLNLPTKDFRAQDLLEDMHKSPQKSRRSSSIKDPNQLPVDWNSQGWDQKTYIRKTNYVYNTKKLQKIQAKKNDKEQLVIRAEDQLIRLQNQLHIDQERFKRLNLYKVASDRMLKDFRHKQEHYLSNI